MAYSGKYSPINPKKYKGDPHRITYRSLWERKFMVYCDNSDSILEWGSEEIIIPYLSPVDGRIHRYFPDFYIKVQKHDGSTEKSIVEIKPKVQCSPPKVPSRKTRSFYNAIKTWAVNEAKWKYATEFCDINGIEFKILNEDHLGITYK
ncbi:MAG: TnsA endonuclease N-terminal domain-containing protein [Candidatus Poseidoniales archaeon]